MLKNNSYIIKKSYDKNGIIITSDINKIKTKDVLVDNINTYQTYGELIVHKTYQKSSGALMLTNGTVDDLYHSQSFNFTSISI